MVDVVMTEPTLVIEPDDRNPDGDRFTVLEAVERVSPSGGKAYSLTELVEIQAFDSLHEAIAYIKAFKQGYRFGWAVGEQRGG